MLIQRERPFALVSLQMPAPLPSLQDAFQRRRALFGPHSEDEPLAAPRGVLARCAAILRATADMLEPAQATT